MAKKIYISPSDQSRNLYAAGGTTEAVQCRRIALAAVKALERCGFEAKTNTTWNGDDAMDRRIAESNAWGADAHIPIHTNAFNGQVTGTRMFCYNTTGEGYRLCRAILDALAPITPGDSDNITPYDWAEVVYANAPTAYVEVGFHDNPTEAQWIIDHTEDIAEAICKGVCKHFGVAYKAAATAPEVAPTHAGKLWRVQVGAFAVRKNAENLRDELKGKGYSAFVTEAAVK